MKKAAIRKGQLPDSVFILFSFIMYIGYLRHIVNLSECPRKKDIRVIYHKVQPRRRYHTLPYMKFPRKHTISCRGIDHTARASVTVLKFYTFIHIFFCFIHIPEDISKKTVSECSFCPDKVRCALIICRLITVRLETGECSAV